MADEEPSWSSWSRLPRRARSLASSASGTSWSPRSATSATCPTTRARCRPSTRASRGVASASTSTTASRRSTSCPPTRRSRSPSSRRCSRTPTSSTSRPTRTARARRSPGTSTTSSSPRCPCTGWSSTRSRPTPSRRRSPARARSTDDLVEAQEARRILDRLYGYEVSPVLWKKVMSGLSAGRVQIVATRLVVDRERERMAFRAAAYWDLEATFDAGEAKRPRTFPAKLTSVDGKRVAQGRDFSSTRCARRTAATSSTSTKRRPVPWPRRCGSRRSRSVGRGEALPPLARTRPFRTTTLQQEASRKLGFGAAAHDADRATAVRERLHHLYADRLGDACRTPAINAARDQVTELYGREYLPDAPRTYQRQGQERAGGARGDPAVGRDLPHPGADRSARRRVPALRADLDAHRRVADARRRGPFGVGADRGDRGESASACEFSASGRVITFARLPEGVRRGTRRPDDRA